MEKKNLVEMINHSIIKNSQLPAFSNYQEESLNYQQVGEKIMWMHYLFSKMKIRKNDKIAVVGKNSVNWAITYLAAVTYGAVIVPLLPDFKAKDMETLIHHSDSKILLISREKFELINTVKMKNLDLILSLEDFQLLKSNKKNADSILKDANRYHREYTRQKENNNGIMFKYIPPESLAALIYTSGTTGFSKGVMLPHSSLSSNITFAQNKIDLKSKDRILSFLPMAHVFGCTFEFLFPFTKGCHVTFLNQPPVPQIILKAFSDIKPKLILSVPLIIENIYRKKIKPIIGKRLVKFMRVIPMLKNLINKKIRKSLMDAFGGEFIEIIIGGAAFSEEVGGFLSDIKFPYTVGYGMSECGPLISYTGWKDYKRSSVGFVVDGMDCKIDSSDPHTVEGEVLVRGENVMTGYYKNKEATESTLDKNNWLHTGDRGIMDKNGYLYLKGRSKNMILGPSGQNIFPEEVEIILNNLPYIQESLVLEKHSKIYAMVYPDMDRLDKDEIDELALTALMEKNKKTLNQQLPSYIKVSSIMIQDKEFEKTPTKKIKRFKYTNS
jgi:long-chain acyl-CoA synthetase